ncbi:MAG: hypothetical protein PUB52_02095 [Lachnospiraceae bacterium]|nr:hypothetical protein [Lachnospiraceae bacterium]
MTERIKRMAKPFVDKASDAIKRKRKNVEKEKDTYKVKAILKDEISACKQIDYMYSKDFINWTKHADNSFREIYTKTKADSYNAGMIDQLIDNQIDLELMSIKEQYVKHLSAIKEILLAQKSRVAEFKQKMANFEVEISEIKERYPDIPTTDLRQMTKSQKSRMPFYKKKWCLFLILGISCVLDYTTISSAVDSLLTQSVFLSTLLSIGTAMLINITPSIAGVYAKNKKGDNRKFVLLLLGGIFTILFLILFGLRWATRDILFTDTSLLFTPSVETSSNTMAEIFMTILLSTEPALTSAMSFVFGYIGASEEEREKDLAEIHLTELYLLRDEYEIHVRELEEVIEKNQNQEDEEIYYQVQLDLMEQYRVHFKEIARIELAQLVAQPQGNGIILQREDAVLFDY